MKYSDEDKELFTFCFEGDNSVDISLLVKTLSGLKESYSSVIATQIPFANIELRVEAFNKGSFETVISSIVSNVPPIIAMGVSTLPNIKMFLDIILLKKDLKGQKPIEVINQGEKTKVVNQSGEIHYHNSNITNIYLNNPIIDKELSSIFMPIHTDNTRTAIKIKEINKEVVINKSEYENMSKQIIDESISNGAYIEDNIISTNLLLKSPDLLGDSQWKFLFDNRMIKATIEDHDFLNKVKTGEEKALYAGVKIPVKLKIETTIDKELEITSRRYIVLNVTGKIIEPTSYNQIKLF